jgi:glucokinase
LVIGGNISAAFPLFRTELFNVFNDESLRIEVLISALQEDAALAGSARLCDREYYERLIKNNLNQI